MKKTFTNPMGGGCEYLAPEVEIMAISVEQGFAASVTYGDEGYAGQDIDNNDYGDF